MWSGPIRPGRSGRLGSRRPVAPGLSPALGINTFSPWQPRDAALHCPVSTQCRVVSLPHQLKPSCQDQGSSEWGLLEHCRRTSSSAAGGIHASPTEQLSPLRAIPLGVAQGFKQKTSRVPEANPSWRGEPAGSGLGVVRPRRGGGASLGKIAAPRPGGWPPSPLCSPETDTRVKAILCKTRHMPAMTCSSLPGGPPVLSPPRMS